MSEDNTPDTPNIMAATLIEAAQATFDDLDVMMRSIELDADEDLKDVSFGLTTFVSCLENMEVYFTIYRQNGELSSNLQRRFREALTETYVTMSRIADPIFDTPVLHETIDGVSREWLSGLTLNEAFATIHLAGVAVSQYMALDEAIKNDERMRTAARRHVCSALLALTYAREIMAPVAIVNDGLDGDGDQR